MLITHPSRTHLHRLVIPLLVLFLGLLGAPAVAKAEQGNVNLPRFPAISPDGSEITFSWRGDLWKVGAQGGHAVRLTSHNLDDLQSAWSPCGERIAFNSMRDGYLNIWVMRADGTDIRQVTRSDRFCTLSGWGVDENGEEVLVFSGYLEADVYREQRPYMVSLDGGDLIRLHEAFGADPVVSPDGSKIAFVRGGRYGGWQRRHYRGPEAMRIWLYDRDDDSFTQLTHFEGNEGNPRWASDRSIIYMSDRELETVNLYRMSAAEGDEVRARLTRFEGEDIQDFDVSADGSTAVMMVWDALYTLDLEDPMGDPVALRITATEDDRDNFELRSMNRSVSEAALSPDGHVMAYVSYGRVYVRNIDDKSPTRRVSPNDHARHQDIAWSPDGLVLYFVSDADETESIYSATVALTRSEIRESFEGALRLPDEDFEEIAANEGQGANENGNRNAGRDDRGDVDDEPDDEVKEEDEEEDEAEEEDLPKRHDPKRWHDALRFDIEPVVQTEHLDRNPSPSPDGNLLAFRRGRGDVMILDLASGNKRRLIKGWDSGIHWRWSPDSRHIAYSQNDLDFSSNIFIVEALGESEPVNITRHPRNDLDPRWSADGRVLLFRSNRVANSYDVWMVYLDRNLEALTPKELDEYYEDASRQANRRRPLPPPPKRKNNESEEKKLEPVELHLDDAWRRIRRVTSFPTSEAQIEITPGGDRYIFSADIDGRALYSIKWDGSDRQRLGGSANVQHLTLKGDKVVFIRGSRAGTVSATGRNQEYVDITDQIRIDLREQASQKFQDAARMIGEMFYHHDMKGLDWNVITEQYHALARQTRTADEFNHVGNRFLGELNASHMGIRATGPTSPLRQPSGRLGTIHHPVQLNDGTRGYEITEIISNSPAEVGTMRLEVGDVITAIELEPFQSTDTVESRLQGMIGEEVIVTVLRQRADGEVVELHTLLTPISFGAFSNLRYRHWRLRNAELVREWSGGRVGYIHIQGMNQPSLDMYERDLYAAAHGKDGLIIDVRNNGGGWTTDRLLASIMVEQHAYTVPRGADPNAAGHYPQDRLFISRYTQPINMLCNEKSFSNAEIISHAFKTLGRGTLVGQETFGGVISTGSYRLIDGTTVRMPFRGWYLPDGTDMENHGAVPDIIIPQKPDAEVRNEDLQLRAALEDLMQRLD